MLDNGFFPFFVGALLFALAGCACWYLVALRLLKAGFRVKFFGTVRDTLSLFRAYRSAAPTRGWSTWPIPVFWLCGAAMFLAAIASALTAWAESAAGFIMLWAHRRILLSFGALSSLSLAIAFSYRVFRKTSGQRSNGATWSQLWADSVLRSDAYVTAIAWLGFLMSATILAAGQFSR